MGKTKLIDDQLRDAVRKSGQTRYRLWQLSGVRQEQIARFLNGQGIGIVYAAKLAAVLGLELKPKGKKGER
jgi:hypothetical protein